MNTENNLAPELHRRREAAWGAYKSIEDVAKKNRNTRLRAHLFNTTVLLALTYASETWAFRKQEENAEDCRPDSQHQVLERKIRCSLCLTRNKKPLGDSGTRSAQMEGLLAPARPVRRTQGVMLITVIKPRSGK
ncbi:hypothetical protein RB195_023278 [Necator americanus]